MSSKKVADRWAFLEEFEAPMWVDLTLEAELSNKELDDEWFHRSHKFHQLPSRKLKAAFKDVDSGEKLEIDIEGSSSPKLPSSVSKSRGKHYVNHKLGTDFQLSLSEKECLIENGDGEASPLNCGNEALHKSDQGDSKSRLHPDQENASENVAFKLSNTSSMPSTNNSSSLNHLEIKEATDDPKSSLTCESSQMPGPQIVDASNRIIGRRSQLLSVMKQSLRKSCAIRMATRGQLTDGRQTNGHKSPSGKSSVGSCSVQTQDTKDLNVAGGVQRTSRTPESTIIERLSQESRTRYKEKTSMDGGTQITNTTSDSGDRREPLKSEAKAANSYPQYVINRDISSNSTSLKTDSTNRASECGNRGKVGTVKVLKTVTATKSTQLVNSRANSSISRVSKAATAHSILEQKLSVPKGTRARTSNRASGNIEAGKSVVAKSTQQQVVMSKALPDHRRPLAPVNQNDQGSLKRPLQPVKEKVQGSLIFARKAKNKGKADAAAKSLPHGKENIISKAAFSIKQHGNSQGMADKSDMMRLTEGLKNNVRGLLLSQKDLRREPAVPLKLRPAFK